MTTINEDRFLADMDALAQIGATAAGGVSRPALSEQDLLARAWLKDRIQAATLDYHQDGAANQFGTFHTDDPAAKTLLIGSHSDSVPDGGRFDGALGLLCALEVTRRLKESGQSLPFHLACVNFTDEEGTLMGLMGSRALSGQITRDDLDHPRGGRETLEAAMRRAGISDESILAAACAPEDLLGYIEVHIEQGTRLEQANLQIGVVTALVGIRMKHLTFTGQAGHAGTTPVANRRDAFLGVADFALRARDRVLAQHVPGVATVGQVDVRPGAFNIVPGSATAALEFRHGSQSDLDALEADLLEIAQAVADDHQLDLTVESLGAVAPCSNGRQPHHPHRSRCRRARPRPPAPDELRRARPAKHGSYHAQRPTVRPQRGRHQPQPARVHRPARLHQRGQCAARHGPAAGRP